MKTITLKNVLPAVFAKERDGGQSGIGQGFAKGDAGQDFAKSDVWLCELEINAGETVLVEAESGRGKSSLAAFLYGYRPDYDGQILFDGQDIRGFSLKKWDELRRSVISLMFQELRLFGELSALDNVMIKNRMTDHLPLSRIEELFCKLGIEDKMQSRAGKMSFGQQQRVAFIRALAQPFDFLIVDEPISHLDDENAKAMGEIMMEECSKRGAALIVTSIGKHIDLPYDRILKL